MMQHMNMAGVVARPNLATRAPEIVSPAARAASSAGPDIRGSLPI